MIFTSSMLQFYRTIFAFLMIHESLNERLNFQDSIDRALKVRKFV